jgi:hypothetical protein
VLIIKEIKRYENHLIQNIIVVFALLTYIVHYCPGIANLLSCKPPDEEHFKLKK